MSRLRRIAIALLLAAGVGGLLYTFQRMDSSSLNAREGLTATLPRYTLIDAELTRYDADGNPSLYGHAAGVDYFEDQSGRARDLQVDLVAEGERTWHLTSPAATLPAHQTRFLLEGPVLGSGRWPDSGEDLVFRTPHLWVDPELHEIDTDVPVNVESPHRNGSAVGLRSDWAERSMQLLRDVKMSYEQQPR